MLGVNDRLLSPRLLTIALQRVLGVVIRHALQLRAETTPYEREEAMKTQDVAVEDPGASEQSARSSLTRSLSAVTSVLVSPRSAFVEIRTGIQLWVPVLLIAMYRVCWLYVQYAPGRRLDKVMLNLGVQAVIVVAECAVLALPLFTLLWIQGGKFALRSLFAVLLTAASVCELGSLIAALVGRAFFDLPTDPAGQVLTNLGWLISAEQHRALHHVLARLDVLELYALVLVAWGAGYVVQGLTRQQIWRTTAVTWVGIVASLTFIKWFVS